MNKNARTYYALVLTYVYSFVEKKDQTFEVWKKMNLISDQLKKSYIISKWGPIIFGTWQ